MLTKAERDEIRARADAATKGPWDWADWSLDDGPDRFTLQAPPETRASWETTKQFSPNLPNRLICDEDKEISLEDRAFISHARDDVPALLDDIDAQDAEVARLTDANDRLIATVRADEWQARYWAEHDAVGDRDATIMAERADHAVQLASYRKALEPFRDSRRVLDTIEVADSHPVYVTQGNSQWLVSFAGVLRKAAEALESPDPGKALLDAHAAELERRDHCEQAMIESHAEWVRRAEAAERDTERLDWRERQWGQPHRTPHGWMVNGIDRTFPTFRAAADAAMKPGP